jgi:hypothetical protein
MGEMNKPLWILCLTIAITGILSFENSVIAVLNVSGNVVQDSNTGLEWLVMSQTVNKSPDRIMAGDYGLKAAGWNHATLSQIETLFLNAGMTKPFNGTGSSDQIWNFDGANHLIALLGYTQEACGLGCSYVISAISADPGTSQGSLYVPNILVSYNQIGLATVPGTSLPSSTASPTIGNWLVRANPAITPPTFGPNSTTLTNIYTPMKVGSKLSYKTYGEPFILYGYSEALTQETIDQVKCIKMKESISDSSNPVAYYWIAQDKSENIWIFQYQDVELNKLRYYGRNYAKIVMPSRVYVGSGLWNPDAIETVVSTGISVTQLSTGLGPYYNCIKSKVINYINTAPESGSDIDYDYYAPAVGLVKEEWNDEGRNNGLEILSITERQRPNSMPWLQLLLND